MTRQQERDEFVARLAKELPALSAYAVADLARRFFRAAATLHRLAELSCSSEAADRDRVPCPSQASQLRADCLCGQWDTNHGTGRPVQHESVPRIDVQAQQVERRIAKLAAEHGLTVLTQGDPRGAVLRIVPPSYAARNAGKDRFNVEGIAVP